MNQIKFKLLSIFLLLNITGCSEDLQLVDVLGKPCYTKEESAVIQISEFSEEYIDKNAGVCSTGKTDKDKNKSLICVGEVKPSFEQCNNLDDDCDGRVDEDVYNYPLTRNYRDPENTCVGPGACLYVTQECSNGNWTCNYWAYYGEEVCDGRDNDCDGEIDEDTPEDPIFPPEERYVYNGESSTINVGECRSGYKVCQFGQTVIRNMRTPVLEICGNGDDDDCDGFTDEAEGDIITSDFVFIIDFSGSMYGVIHDVSEALCQWSQQGILQDSRFAVVAVGYSNTTTQDEYFQVELLTDFTDSGTACQAIRRSNYNNQGGVELQIDALYNIHNRDSSLYLSWSENNKKVIIFSDEMMQQTITNDIQETLSLISEQCFEKQYTVSAFVSYDIPDHGDWLMLTQSCGGFLDYLSSSSQNMMDKLNYWIGSDC